MKRYSSATPPRLYPLSWAANQRDGFTLLEAAVAMMVIGVVSAAALSAFAADLRAADQAQRMLPAAALAQDRMAALETTLLTSDMLADSLSRGRFEAPFAEYSWTASAHRLAAIPDLIELQVDVSWPAGSFNLIERRYEPLPIVAGR